MWRPPLAALLLSALAFGGSLWGTRIFDDFHSVFANPSVQDLGNLGAFFADPQSFSIYPGAHYRPITLSSYALTFALFGESLPAFHAGNLLFHLACVLALYGLILALLRSLRRSAAENAAAIGATVFGIHPGASQVVHYISGRSESLALAGTLFALACHAWSLLPASSRRARVVLRVLVVLGVAFALGSKETGILAMPLLVGVDLAMRPWNLEDVRRRVVRLIAPSALVLIYFAVQILPGMTRSIVAVGGAGHRHGNGSDWLLRSLRSIWVYLETSILPVKLAVWRELQSTPWDGLSATLAALVLFGALVLAVALLLGARRRGAGLALLFFFFPFVPYLFRPLNLAVNENRLYPPLTGIGLAVALLYAGPLRRWIGDSKARQRLVVAVGVLMLSGMLIRDWRASYIWASETRLWDNAIAVSPHVGDFRAGLGTAYMRQERWREATQLFEEALQRSPKQPAVIYDNLGISAYMMGDLPAAHGYFRQAYLYGPDSIEILNNLGSILHKLGRPEEALPYLDRAAELSPGYCEPQIEAITVTRSLQDPDGSRARIGRLAAHCRADPRVAEVEEWAAQEAGSRAGDDRR
jgi:tetratricopeptide (TPR) repeat protein